MVRNARLGRNLVIRSRTAALAAILTLTGCGAGGPATPPPTIPAAGTYDATFTATEATGCQGFVEPGSTSGALAVTQSAGQATLRLGDLTEFVRSDPTGAYDPANGQFAFDGVIVVGNEQGTVNADGTIVGTFSPAGAVNLTFDFTAFTCRVRGTIVGQRR